MKTVVQSRYGLTLAVLIVLQSLCAAFFLYDVVTDYLSESPSIWFDFHLMVEAVAAMVLVFGIIVETQFLMAILRRQVSTERGLSIASGNLNKVMDDYFRSWGLTPTEEDVAAFTLKGLSIAEIAVLRGSREGTIKAHLNAIYRKSGVSGRSQLVSLLVEDLMQEPLLAQTQTQHDEPSAAIGTGFSNRI
ncbi:MAG: helix-turn-helix transcriptional regulator [Paracoccaceae bacterium]